MARKGCLSNFEFLYLGKFHVGRIILKVIVRLQLTFALALGRYLGEGDIGMHQKKKKGGGGERYEYQKRGSRMYNYGE